MKPKYCIFLTILLFAIIFAIGCNQATQPQPSKASFQPVAWLSGQPGDVNLTPTEGNGPFQCALAAGALPPGFALNNCVISGTAPVLAGGTTKSISPPFTIAITNGAGQQQNLEYKILTVASIPEIIFNEPGACIVNEKCSVNLIAQVNGGTPPYYFQPDTFRNGAPPMGMIVDVNGILTGTPSKTGQYTFGVCAVDVVAASKCGQTSVIIEDEMEPLGEASGAAEEISAEKAEAWKGTITGTVTPFGCEDATYAFEHSLNFDFPASLSEVWNSKGWTPGTGAISGKMTVPGNRISIISEEIPGIQPGVSCEALDNLISNVNVEVTSVDGMRILVGTPLEVAFSEDPNRFLLKYRYDFRSSSKQELGVEGGFTNIGLLPTSVSANSISGELETGTYNEIKGAFTLIRVS